MEFKVSTARNVIVELEITKNRFFFEVLSHGLCVSLSRMKGVPSYWNKGNRELYVKGLVVNY